MGGFKSTFINEFIAPPCFMPQYFSSSALNLEKTERINVVLAEKFIVHLDDTLRSLNKKDNDIMKNLITQHEISFIRPYGKNIEEYPRLANFIATLNGKEFLAEDENRRYLPFVVINISIEQAAKVNRNLVWKEAYNLYKSGYKYYKTKDELNNLFDSFKGYQISTVEGELFIKYFKGYKVGEKLDIGGTAMTVTDILVHLTTMSKMNLVKSRLTTFLRNKNIEYKTRAALNGSYAYTVYKYSNTEVVNNEITLQSETNPVKF